MNCPVCKSEDHAVLRSRSRQDVIRRTRSCRRCGHRWATLEIAEVDLAADRERLARARRLAAALEDG